MGARSSGRAAAKAGQQPGRYAGMLAAESPESPSAAADRALSDAESRARLQQRYERIMAEHRAERARESASTETVLVAVRTHDAAPGPHPGASAPAAESPGSSGVPRADAASGESAAAETPAEPDDPASWRDAMSRPDAAGWRAAAQEELSAHAANGTWALLPVTRAELRALGLKPIGNRWVFKTKLRSDGSVERLKARLVAKGFSQRAGFDYDETYSPVLQYKSLRLLLIVSAALNYELRQLDVKTAFLNAHMQQDVWMLQPEGFEEQGKKAEWLCKLLRTLYGTKQASMEWHAEVNAFLIGELGFTPTVSEPTKPAILGRTNTGASGRIESLRSPALTTYSSRITGA